jgi:hypothetical protein
LEKDIKNKFETGCWQLMPVILATQKGENGSITVQSQPRQIMHETPLSKKPITKKGW